MHVSPALVVTATVAGTFIILLFKWAGNRQHVRELQAAGAPMPHFHPLFGHLLVLKEAIQALPRNAVVHTVFRRIGLQFPNGCFYMNLWPFNQTLIVVTSPYLASQVESAFLNKPPGMCRTLDVISGGPSIQTMHGDVWKKWRSLFNTGFASGHMTTLAPQIAEEVAVFCRLLQKRADEQEIFQLEEYTLRMTFDVIGRVTFDARLHYQTQGSALADSLRRQVYWTSFGTTFNPFRRYLSPRPLVQKYNSYRMNRYLSEQIDRRFEELNDSQESSDPNSRTNSRSVISLVMDEFRDEVSNKDTFSKEEFKREAIPHLRMFLYAGHDTTSSSLLYCFLLLSRHNDVLSKLRAEHDSIFGNNFDLEQTMSRISQNPSILNQIPYTLAVIKEVLRLFPPAASMREGRANLTLSDRDGNRYPTNGCHIWTLSLSMHHDDQIFVDPERFLPERWLADAGDPLYPNGGKGSWRAFEWGIRNCIGQTLAVLELKVALVMTVRLFDIVPVYEEWDRLHPTDGIKSIDGNRAYQAEMGGGGAHPVDGFPVRVNRRRQNS